MVEDNEPTRYVAAGGWRRAVVGVAVGLVAGLLASAALARGGASRRSLDG